MSGAGADWLQQNFLTGSLFPQMHAGSMSAAAQERSARPFSIARRRVNLSGSTRPSRFLTPPEAASAIRTPRSAIGDAKALPVEDETFDVAVAGLVLNFVADPARALCEMQRAVRPGGSVAVYVWDYAGEMQLMRRFWEAAAALDPAARELDEGQRFPICKPGPLRALFAEAGLGGIQDREIDVPTVFRDFEDYWSPFLGGQGPAPGYCVSLSEAQGRSPGMGLCRSRSSN
jgi:SAM-dependent methyltransferase